MDQITISSDSDSDASMFASSTTTHRHPPQTHHHHHTHTHPTITTTTPNNPSSSTTPSVSTTEKRKSTTHRTHETIHLANTILSSRELLLLHSLAANESVPRTRRRFMAQVIEAEDLVKASKIIWGHQSGSSSATAAGGGRGTAVGGLRVAAGNVVDVVEMDDGNGWERLRTRKSSGSSTGGRSSPMARGTSSPGRGTKKGLQQRVVSGSRAASRSGSPFASPVVRRRGRREDGDGDVDMDIY